MIRRLLPLLIFLALGTLLFAGVMLSRNQNREAIPSPLIGRPAPAFALPALHEPSATIRNETLRGAPYVLNVWGSWCPECRNEHAVIAALAKSGRVKVIGYNYKDERADALRWLQQFGDPYHLIVVDAEGRKALDWGIYAAPETFLVDAGGVVRWKYIGPMTQQVVEEQLLPRLAEAGDPQ